MLAFPRNQAALSLYKSLGLKKNTICHLKSYAKHMGQD